MLARIKTYFLRNSSNELSIDNVVEKIREFDAQTQLATQYMTYAIRAKDDNHLYVTAWTEIPLNSGIPWAGKLRHFSIPLSELGLKFKILELDS